MDHNLNLAECIVRQSRIGDTLITNICNGSSQALPWQFGDWAGFYTLWGLGFMGAIACLMFIGMLISVVRGY